MLGTPSDPHHVDRSAITIRPPRSAALSPHAAGGFVPAAVRYSAGKVVGHGFLAMPGIFKFSMMIVLKVDVRHAA
jgi:hypothetical protein